MNSPEMASVQRVADLCNLDLDSAAALLAAADGDVDTALSIHVVYNNGQLVSAGEGEDGQGGGDAWGGGAEFSTDASDGTRVEDAERGSVEGAADAAPDAAHNSVPESLVSDAVVVESGECFAHVARVNIDGVEGSTIPGALHLARYGGGEEYQQQEPLLSVWCAGASMTRAAATSAWQAAATALSEVTVDSLQLLHGFGRDEVMPGGAAPDPASVRVEPRTQLLVSRMPVGGAHASLMLHGWLFAAFPHSDRKAHQKFPLLCLSSPHNLAPAPDDPRDPRWLPIPSEASAGGGAAVGYADQHVHKDEPVDLGGFLFSEVLVGSDMARIRPSDSAAPSAVWVVALDVETRRALATLAIALPEAEPDSEAEATLDSSVGAARSNREVAAALSARWGEAAEGVVEELLRLER
mmetsp:Transcript_39915/g.94726  ORF Transcript_39915/g.94726 Transcript_39915/m.94726 type:complete len:410 (+) Transcript_39915:389-1618(+)